MCIGDDYPLLKNVRHGLIDPDTPDSEKTRKGENGKTLNLVFSDEFNEDGRTFYDNDDPFYQGVDIWYGVTMDLEVCEATSSEQELLSPSTTGLTYMSSGTILMRSQPKTAPSTFASMPSKITISTTDLVCCSHGINYALRVDCSKPRFLSLAEVTR